MTLISNAIASSEAITSVALHRELYWSKTFYELSQEGKLILKTSWHKLRDIINRIYVLDEMLFFLNTPYFKEGGGGGGGVVFKFIYVLNAAGVWSCKLCCIFNL